MLYVSIILAAFLFLLGISNGWAWLYVPLGLFLLITLAGLDKPRSHMEAAPAVSPGPLIRPIVIKKKYVGPPSIYPEKMDILVNPRWDHHTTWEKTARGAGQLGVFIDRMIAKAVKGGDSS